MVTRASDAAAVLLHSFTACDAMDTSAMVEQEGAQFVACVLLLGPEISCVRVVGLSAAMRAAVGGLLGG